MQWKRYRKTMYPNNIYSLPVSFRPHLRPAELSPYIPRRELCYGEIIVRMRVGGDEKHRFLLQHRNIDTKYIDLLTMLYYSSSVADYYRQRWALDGAILFI